ncbi:MAG: NAD(P)H-dependent oxidoreductase subunit E, partial [Rhodospirillales bacterium]|nr:NAD(P)H-dependent oxidoreductase subunit E [Rhodospirillales bacterium]
MSDGDSKPRKFPHPGAGRSRAAIHPKGRQLDSDAHGDILALLGDRSRQQDLLIEYLHLIQDKYRCLAPDHLVALAHEMRLSLAEIYETATFYAHFDVLGDDEPAPPEITIRVCDSIACEMAGAEALIDGLAGKSGGNVRIKRAPCMGGCDCAPVAEIGHNQLPHATVETISEAVAASAVAPVIPDYCDYDAYVASGGYKLLRDCLAGDRSPEDIMDALDASGMRGLGGAGFPTGRKWRIVRDMPAPRMFAINADEGEPGTFKDRHFLETDPHRMLEGALVAAWVVGTDITYLYLRDEYAAIRHILQKEIPRLVSEGLVAADALQLRRGAGAYICGEESAM